MIQDGGTVPTFGHSLLCQFHVLPYFKGHWRRQSQRCWVSSSRHLCTSFVNCTHWGKVQFSSKITNEIFVVNSKYLYTSFATFGNPILLSRNTHRIECKPARWYNEGKFYIVKSQWFFVTTLFKHLIIILIFEAFVVGYLQIEMSFEFYVSGS